jgi:hypothetical protein
MAKQVRDPIATWWRISTYGPPEITPVPVVHVATSFVITLEKRQSWVSHPVIAVGYEYLQRRDNIFPSFAEAKAEAIKKAQSVADSAKSILERAESQLIKWQAVKEPEGEQ